MSTLKSEVKTIRVPVQLPIFDRAVELAETLAANAFGIDEDGHPADRKFPRSQTALCVEFEKFYARSGCGGGSYVFIFKAFLERTDD